MANAKLAVMPSVRSRGVIMKKVRSLIETARVMMDRDLVKLLREARKDIKEGKTVPLSSLIKGMGEIKQIDPTSLSKYIINRVHEMGHSVSHLKLQKLLYYCAAWHMVYFDGKQLISEDFEAWMHGPVIREVWNYYRDESVLYDDIQPVNLGFDIRDILNDEQVEVIDDALEEYGKRSAYYLECLTHDEKPWREARRGYVSSDRCEETISKEIMRKFYGEMLYGETWEKETTQ